MAKFSEVVIDNTIKDNNDVNDRQINSTLNVEDYKNKKEEELKKEKEKLLAPQYNKSISNVKNIHKNISNVIHRPLTSRIEFPHIAIGSFARAFRDFIHYSVYSKFKGIIFGSYNRAIQNYLQRVRINESGDSVIDFGLPLFNYTIQIEGPDEKLNGSWRNTTYYPKLADAIYPPFYEDENFKLTIVYRRLKGIINSNIYCNSEAEALDIQMNFYDSFRGINTYSAASIKTMTILPDEILFIENNKKRISVALDSNKITKSFIPSVNDTKYYIFNNSKAIINMQSINPNHNYYGGAGLPDFSLNASFSFDLEIPQYILCMTRENFTGIDINIDVSYKYEDDDVINSLKYITGDHININTNDKNIIPFENGYIIDRMLYKIENDSQTDIPFMDLFKDKQLNWNYQNRDIIVLLIYSGGLIRIPVDGEIVEYDENGNLKFKKDLFNKEDLIEFYVFKLIKDIEFD